jgi:hypothetical protein
VGPDGRYLLLIQGLPGAETPGSYDAYQAAKDAGVSAPAEALLIAFIGNQGKVSFSEIWYGWGDPDLSSGTHRTLLGNPRRPIQSVAAWELKCRESIQFYYKKRAFFLQKQNRHCQKVSKIGVFADEIWVYKHPNF